MWRMLTRRAFLQSVAASAAAAPILVRSSVSDAAPAFPIPAVLGLELYSVRQRMAKDIPGTLRIVRDWGFTLFAVALLGIAGLRAAAGGVGRLGSVGRLAAAPLVHERSVLGPLVGIVAVVTSLAALDATVGASFGQREVEREETHPTTTAPNPNASRPHDHRNPTPIAIIPRPSAMYTTPMPATRNTSPNSSTVLFAA